MKILVLEDDRTIHFGLKQHLSKHYGEIVSAYTIAEAKRMIDDSIDLYLLDVMLPDGTGFDVLKEIRKTSNTPALFLSAHDDQNTIDTGFNLGGDDYITKPFRLNDLDNRIRSIQRRSNIKRVGYLSIDLDRALVLVHNVKIDLSVIEYQLLLQLVQHSPNTISKELLIDKVWGEASDNTLSVNIRRLRSKLGEDIDIQTVAGKGYFIK